MTRLLAFAAATAAAALCARARRRAGRGRRQGQHGRSSTATTHARSRPATRSSSARGCDENERYRIPEALRQSSDPGERALGQQGARLTRPSATSAPLSCSPVGAGGELGCTAQMIEAAYAEKRDEPRRARRRADRRRRAPSGSRRSTPRRPRPRPASRSSSAQYMERVAARGRGRSRPARDRSERAGRGRSQPTSAPRLTRKRALNPICARARRMTAAQRILTDLRHPARSDQAVPAGPRARGRRALRQPRLRQRRSIAGCSTRCSRSPGSRPITTST